MTFTEILTDLRAMIVDEGTSPRWTDAVLRTYAYDGELAIVRNHPEAQYGTRMENSTPVLLASNTDSFTISVQWRMALIHYIMFRCLSEDSDDAANAKLAQTQYALFEGSMK